MEIQIGFHFGSFSLSLANKTWQSNSVQIVLEIRVNICDGEDVLGTVQVGFVLLHLVSHTWS